MSSYRPKRTIQGVAPFCGTLLVVMLQLLTADQNGQSSQIRMSLVDVIGCVDKFIMGVFHSLPCPGPAYYSTNFFKSTWSAAAIHIAVCSLHERPFFTDDIVARATFALSANCLVFSSASIIASTIFFLSILKPSPSFIQLV